MRQNKSKISFMLDWNNNKVTFIDFLVCTLEWKELLVSNILKFQSTICYELCMHRAYTEKCKLGTYSV